MARSNFENLAVYQLSERISDIVWGIASNWDNLARDTVGKQLIRAADSIGANIAEGEAEARIKRTNVSYELHVRHLTKPNTGFGVPTTVTSLIKIKLQY
jgi:hypothetical protein